MTSHLMLFKSFIQELLRSSKHICTVNVLQYWPRMLYKVQNQNNTSVLALQAFHAYKLLYLCNKNNNNILPKVHHIAAQLYLIYRFIAVLFLSSYQVGVNRKLVRACACAIGVFQTRWYHYNHWLFLSLLSSLFFWGHHCSSRKGCPRVIIIVRNIMIATKRKFWEPYDNPFWKNSDGGEREKRKEEKKSMIIVVPSCLKDADGARTRSDQLWSLCLPGIFENSGHYICLP